jgi:antitoxin component of MazEF toxin-antitoxin module
MLENRLKVLIYGKVSKCVIIPKKECEMMNIEKGDVVTVLIVEVRKKQ